VLKRVLQKSPVASNCEEQMNIDVPFAHVLVTVHTDTGQLHIWASTDDAPGIRIGYGSVRPAR
jgi:hypothetical protein